MSATRSRRSSSSSSCNCAIKDHKGGATPGPAPSGGRALSPLWGGFFKAAPYGCGFFTRCPVERPEPRRAQRGCRGDRLRRLSVRLPHSGLDPGAERRQQPGGSAVSGEGVGGHRRRFGVGTPDAEERRRQRFGPGSPPARPDCLQTLLLQLIACEKTGARCTPDSEMKG